MFYVSLNSFEVVYFPVPNTNCTLGTLYFDLILYSDLLHSMCYMPRLKFSGYRLIDADLQ